MGGKCINDLLENGLQNDHINLLHIANSSAKVARKTSTGLTQRMNIGETIMQGKPYKYSQVLWTNCPS